MQITLSKKDGVPAIELSGDAQSVYITTAASKTNKWSIESEVIVVATDAKQPTEKTKGGGLILADQGEFEKDGIFINIYEKKPSGTGRGFNLDLVEVEYEGVRILYYALAEEFSKELLTDLGVIDILILDVRGDYKQQLKAVNSIDPQILLPISAEPETMSKFKQDLGAQLEVQKRFKAKAADFVNDEYVMHSVLLEE